MRELILASASPRRRSILKEAGFKFTVKPSPFAEEEDFSGDIPALELALTLSAKKSDPVARANPEAVVLAADTLVVLREHIMGKPDNESEARAMLRSLSGCAHRVVTGFTVQCKAFDKVVSRAISTTVHFRELTDEEIAGYVATGESMDKAGAYGIQGLGGKLVEKVEGDYLNVVGLPLDEVKEVLSDFGITPSS
ncbi:MAG TPA: septum formation protein Maf [Nitrospirae bacterium]|nr:septum formation protein Maf [Nitrospirota bacterium]